MQVSKIGCRLSAVGLFSSSESLSPANPKFVIFGRPIGGALPAASEAGAILTASPDNRLLRRIMSLHSKPVNKTLFELPFTGLWDRVLFGESTLSSDDKVYFLFYEGTDFAYSRNYLKHLRKKYPNCRLVHLFRNPMCEAYFQVLRNWQTVRDYYDASVTLNRYDAGKLGILFCDYWPCLLPDKDFQPANASDVFFIAQAKDRLPVLLSVYERLADAGLKCIFHITGVPEREQKYADVIRYNQWLSYDEVLQNAVNTKCVLEILPYGQNYSSLRVCEALWYRRKLLTTNLEAPDEWFYDPRIVQTFSRAQDIDTEFITRPLSPKDEHDIFGGMVVGDFNRFADWLVKNVP